MTESPKAPARVETPQWLAGLLTFGAPVVPALAIGLFWVWSLARGESLSDAAMYRYGDYNYYPWLAGLTHFGLGESFVYERLGEGIRSFPFASLALHGVAMGLLGTVGFVVADVVVAVSVYFATRALFRSAGLSVVTTTSLALVVSCGLLSWPGSHVGDWLGWDPGLHLWGYRFPRPLLTDLFMLLCVGLLLRLVLGRQASVREWALLGLWFSLLLQSRFYSATTVGLVIVASMAFVVFRRGKEESPALRGPAVFALVAAVVALPFVVQRLYEHPDVPLRFGVFAVDRWSPRLLEGVGRDFVQVALGMLLAGLLARMSGVSNRRERLGSMLILTTLFLASSLALPVSTIILGRTVEPYHFRDELVTFKTLVLVVGAGQIADSVAAWLSPRLRAIDRVRRPLGVMWLVAVAAASLFGASRLHAQWIDFQSHGRSDCPAYRAPDYRPAFRALTYELESNRYGGTRVLATLDIQVLDWWSLFGGGQAFCPDPGATDISDDEIEERLLELFRTLGVSETDMVDLIHDRAVMIFFLGCAKYQASSWHRFAPLEDYPEPVRSASLHSSPFRSWTLAMPNSESQRLLLRYQRTPPLGDDLRLDLIVLGPGRLKNNLAPPPERFEQTYSNVLFQVYRRRVQH